MPPATSAKQKTKPSRKEFKLFPFQEKPTQALTEFLVDINDLTGTCLQGGTGSGKTFILAGAVKEAQARGLYLENSNRPFQHYSILFLCPRNCVVQQERAFRLAGIKNFIVTSYDSLRTDFGELFLSWQTIIKNGVEDVVPVWDPETAPDIIICDESQYLKNFNSQRGKVLKDYIAQKLGKLIFASATHCQKPGEGEYMVLGCGVVPNHTAWNDYVNIISPGGPYANSPIAIKRIREDLELRNKWIPVKGVRYPFKPKIENKKLILSNPKRIIYNAAFERMQEARRKAGKEELSGLLAVLNAIREFQKCSELLMADEIAEISVHIKNTYENSIIYGTNFIDSLLAVKHFLLKSGVPPEEISELHGGITQKKKQENIDKFQYGETRYFLTTLKSGGTGLSLHHEYETSFPRTMLMRLPWSVYEFLQFLGRGQRITNLSPVKQYLLSYKNTIEEDVADRLEEKLGCVTELMDRRDSFIKNIFNEESDARIIEELEKDALKGEDGESGSGEENDEESSGFDVSMLDGDK